MKKPLFSFAALALAAILLLSACNGDTSSASAITPATSNSVSSAAAVPPSSQPHQPVTILVAAASSLEYSLAEELIPLFEKQYGWITVEGSYNSSGKLQTQIEEGLEADIFMSAATKQMNKLVESGIIDADSVVNLLENEIVLISASDAKLDIHTFEDITKAASIAIGDPESVPAGQYAREALQNLGLWDAIQPKVSLGTNVTEVLNWVAEGSAEVGIVYSTDAATTNAVTVIATAPEGSLEKKIVYPVGIIATTSQREAADLFVAFLQTKEALAVFEKFGFTAN